MVMLFRLRELSSRSTRLRNFSETEGEPEVVSEGKVIQGGPVAGNGLHGIAASLRAAQLYAHNAHNLAIGDSFFADHEFLGELYGAYESSYDRLVELIIGERLPIDLQAIAHDAMRIVDSAPDYPFPSLLQLEKHLQQEIDAAASGETDQGVLQVLGSIAEESKSRAYKLGQRCNGSPTPAEKPWKGFCCSLASLSRLSVRLREFDSRPRNANGQYEPNIESGLTPDAMHAAYGSRNPAEGVAAIDQRVGGDESELSRKIRSWRAKGIPVPPGEEAPGGGVGSAGTTL